ncbi:MAG: murein L,D-transpeptidase [Rhizobiales bacterium]|nr:murein L,D-transpeptidase [Hyphomicrobiales bacterium]
MRRKGRRRWVIPLVVVAALVSGATFLFLRSDHPLVESARSFLVSRIYAFLHLDRTFPGESIQERLQGRGFAVGDPVVIRIFKEESKLEIWMEKQGRFLLALTYDICAWSGKLGPKLREGDNQSPEGFYLASSRQLNPRSNYHRAINIGFPNAYDLEHGRTGTYLMIHGACVSIGCYAMTDAVADDIFRIVEGALNAGQASVPIHILPFRMTPENLARHRGSNWADFWNNLAEGDRMFLRSGAQPRVSACQGRYVFGETDASCRAITSWQ